MMWNFAVFTIAALCFQTIGLAESKIADADFLRTQKIVFDLLYHVDQPEYYPEHYEVGLHYDISEHIDSYSDPNVVNNFVTLYQQGMQPRGQVFSTFDNEHLENMIALFALLYSAKDFNTFYYTAAWARIHVNEGMFVQAFSTAVSCFPATRNMVLPPMSEIYPHLYFSGPVMQEATNAKLMHVLEHLSSVSDHEIVIPANYSNLYQNFNYGEESQLNYFVDDVWMNNIQYFGHVGRPLWMKNGQFHNNFVNRGAMFFWEQRTLLARYNMERLSHNLEPVQDFDWSYEIPSGYHTALSYHNGVPLPQREGYSRISRHFYSLLKQVRELETRIMATIDWGYAATINGTFESIKNPEGIQILGNIVEGNMDSVNVPFYGSYQVLARNVLAPVPQVFNSHNYLPSALQHWSIGQRDPLYWSLAKRILSFYEQYVDFLPSYTHQDLVFDTVRIESVAIDKIETYLEPANHLISNGIKATGPNDTLLIKARQYRLTHKPFYHRINVHSDNQATASIRIFLGSTYDAYHNKLNYADNYNDYILVDQWMVNLKPGENNILRSSLDTSVGVADQVSSDVLYSTIQNAIDGKEQYEIPDYEIWNYYGLPKRMMIPRGSSSGMNCTFMYFMSYGDQPATTSENVPLKNYAVNEFSTRPPGYPMDRQPPSNLSGYPNVYFVEHPIFYIGDF